LGDAAAPGCCAGEIELLAQREKYGSAAFALIIVSRSVRSGGQLRRTNATQKAPVIGPGVISGSAKSGVISGSAK
jgi:hypothetical protein